MKQLACTLLLILTTGVFAVETPPEIRGVLQRREAARAEADKVLHEAQAKANDEAVKELEKLLKAEKKKKVQPLTTTLEQRIEALNKESALLRDERLLQATAINERLSRKEFTAEEWDAVQGQVLVTVAAKESRTGVKVTMGPGELHLLVPHPDDLWQNNVVLWAGPKTHLVHYPLRRGELYNLVAVFHSDRYEEGWDVFGDSEELRRKFADERPEVKRLLDKIDVWKMWVLCDREPVKNWTRGNVTLLGDAAHPTLQYLAQGACMAFEDAVVLAQRLATTPDDPNRAFLAYQEARYLRTARIQLTARAFGGVLHAGGVARELRNSIYRGRAPDSFFHEIDWIYRGIAETEI